LGIKRTMNEQISSIKAEAKRRIERLVRLDARQELIDNVIEECNHRIEEYLKEESRKRSEEEYRASLKIVHKTQKEIECSG